jgi:hypothetical protein
MNLPGNGVKQHLSGERLPRVGYNKTIRKLKNLLKGEFSMFALPIGIAIFGFISLTSGIFV